MFTSFFNSPIGWLEITSDEKSIKAISFRDEITASDALPNAITDEAQKQLASYFSGHLVSFDLPLAPQGTPFQLEIWKLLIEIPFGKSISYLDLSKRYGDEKAIRAIAAANGKNPIAIIIPCHRVIGKDGKLVGYSGGLFRKQYLLNLESNQTQLF
jgi:methylated-DNA-[protein]-cysteine S-methyltransferase